MMRAACAPVMVAAPIVSTCLLGRLKFERLVKLKASQRNWALARSVMLKRLLNERLNAMKPGPSRIFRPELPKRNALVGTTGNAARLNQACGVGFGTLPLVMRSGLVGSPSNWLVLFMTGVKG